MGCDPVRFIPPFLVVIFASAISLTVIFKIFPDIYSHTNHQNFTLFVWVFVTFLYFMFMWSWIYASFSDPGRLEDDLKAKGVLKQILQGDVPYFLEKLPICPICKLPMPPNCTHCQDCKKCILRMDHHCAVTGQCIGDKNFKAFILTFFYGGVLGITLLCTSILAIANDVKDIVTILVLIYGGILGLVLMFFLFLFIEPSYASYFPPSQLKYRRSVKIPFCKGLSIVINSFGKTPLQKLIPIQKTTTQYAWLGIDWDIDATEETPLL